MDKDTYVYINLLATTFIATCAIDLILSFLMKKKTELAILRDKKRDMFETKRDISQLAQERRIKLMKRKEWNEKS
jgi:hypothetical protein